MFFEKLLYYVNVIVARISFSLKKKGLIMEIFEMNCIADSFVAAEWDCCKECGPLKPVLCKKKPNTSLQVNKGVKTTVQTNVYTKKVAK